MLRDDILIPLPDDNNGYNPDIALAYIKTPLLNHL